MRSEVRLTHNRNVCSFNCFKLFAHGNKTTTFDDRAKIRSLITELCEVPELEVGTGQTDWQRNGQTDMVQRLTPL